MVIKGSGEETTCYKSKQSLGTELGWRGGFRAWKLRCLHQCEAAGNNLLISQAAEKVGPQEKMSFCLETDPE